MTPNQMFVPNLMIVGGSWRHVGKTTFITSVIRRLSNDFKIIGLKVTTVRSGEEAMHGQHQDATGTRYEIFEEKSYSGIKDTSKMLLAGAEKVYYIRSADEYLPEAFTKLYQSIGKDKYIICESISLRKIVQPSVFILIDFSGDHPRKSTFNELVHLSDMIIYSDIQSLEDYAKNIRITHLRWTIK